MNSSLNSYVPKILTYLCIFEPQKTSVGDHFNRNNCIKDNKKFVWEKWKIVQDIQMFKLLKDKQNFRRRIEKNVQDKWTFKLSGIVCTLEGWNIKLPIYITYIYVVYLVVILFGLLVDHPNELI